MIDTNIHPFHKYHYASLYNIPIGYTDAFIVFLMIFSSVHWRWKRIVAYQFVETTVSVSNKMYVCTDAEHLTYPALLS
jgi:hypothetical protein